MLDFVGVAKWDSWKKLGEMPADEAQQLYIALVTRLYPEWEDSGPEQGGGAARPAGQGGDSDSDFESDGEDGGGGGGGMMGGPRVSTMILGLDEEFGGGGGGPGGELCLAASEGDVDLVSVVRLFVARLLLVSYC